MRNYENDQARTPPDSLLLKQVKDLLRARRFGAEYQPIVSTRTLRITGYEALSRFYLEDGFALPPNITFAAIQRVKSLFGLVEYQTKRLQIKHAPADFPLFINIDPAAYFSLENGLPDVLQSFTDLLHQRDGLVVELVECASNVELMLAQRLATALSHMDLEWALDDVGGDRTLLSIDLFVQARYLKLDRAWLQRPRHNGKLDLLQGIIRYARKAGKRTILEGVETEEDLDTALHLGVDFVQGYLFRSSFINVTAFPDSNDP